VTTLPPREASDGSDRIFVEDIRFYGHHGVTEAQQSVGAWFSVDVEVTLDLTPASLSDDLRATVEYGEVVHRVVEIGTKERVNLLERLGALVAEALLREFPVRAVRVRVRKLTPPIEGIHGIPGVELIRRR
jgi:dihydroneopterin aldolase